MHVGREQERKRLAASSTLSKLSATINTVATHVGSPGLRVATRVTPLTDNSHLARARAAQTEAQHAFPKQIFCFI